VIDPRDWEGRVYVGDCLPFLKELPDGCVDLLVTDPPYFQPAVQYPGTRDSGPPPKTFGDLSLLGAVFRVWMDEAARVLSERGTAYVFCDGQSYPLLFAAMYGHFRHVRPLVWDKMTSFNGYTWRHQHELIAWGERAESQRVPTGDGDILRCPAVPVGERIHPAEKPESLLSALIAKHSGGLVADFFCGSGPTFVACERLGRRWIGCEINPEYAAMAEKRIQRERDKLQLPLGATE